jgi:hypothetical protein
MNNKIMANTFKERKPEKVREEAVQKPPQPKTRPQRIAKPAVPKKGIRKAVRIIRKGFENIFGGGILQKINIRKNWAFFLMLVGMVIVLIYSNLKVQSLRQQIHELEQEIVTAKNETMDVLEEGYNIDKEKEREILQEGEEKGLSNSGYLPYIIEAEDNNQKK